jgi:uncharacterized integral membrane protein
MSTPAQEQRPISQESSEQEQSTRSLWQSAAGRVLLAIIFTVLVFIVSAGADLLMLHEHEPARFTIELSDAVSAVVIGLLSYQLIRFYHFRREHVRKRVEVISDMNHHVRNALQVIALTSHGKDKEEIAAIRESVNRIQWALRELLPKI